MKSKNYFEKNAKCIWLKGQTKLDMKLGGIEKTFINNQNLHFIKY